jgi:hypothetical protein
MANIKKEAKKEITKKPTSREESKVDETFECGCCSPYDTVDECGCAVVDCGCEDACLCC